MGREGWPGWKRGAELGAPLFWGAPAPWHRQWWPGHQPWHVPLASGALLGQAGCFFVMQLPVSTLPTALPKYGFKNKREKGKAVDDLHPGSTAGGLRSHLALTPAGQLDSSLTPGA